MSALTPEDLGISTNPPTRKEQAGFRGEEGTTEQIFSLRGILEQCNEWQRNIYIKRF